MRGVYRGVHSILLDEPDFQRLTPRARHVFLTARLCKDAGPACIFRYYPEVLMRQTGYSRRQLTDALEELSRENWAYSDGSVIWLRNGLRHDPHVRLNDRKHLAAVLRQLDGLPASALIARFRDYYKIGRASDGPSKTQSGMLLREGEGVGEGNPPTPLAASPPPNGHQPKRRGQGQSGAALAWASIMRAVRAGMPSMPTFRDQRVSPTLEAMGGWRRVSHLNGRDVEEVTVATVRKEFMQLYAALESTP